MELDELDKRILSQLQMDASLSNQALSERVFASAPTCLRRVRELRKQGVIQKQIALLNPDKLSPRLTAIVEINLLQQSTERFIEFEKLLLAEEAVSQCYRVSSGPDFVVILSVPDMNAYHELANRLFTSHHDVRNVRTFFSIHRSKFETKQAL